MTAEEEGTLATGEAAAADGLASAHSYLVTPFVTRTPRAHDSSCPWHLIGLVHDGERDRAAVAWIIADAIMRERCGHTRTYELWRTAALGAGGLSEEDGALVSDVVRPVFGLPPSGNQAADHVPGHVGEWLWYLLTREEQSEARELALLEPPSWSVTEGGGDGFVVHRVNVGSTATLIFRLWEIKKFTGVGHVSGTITKAAAQLASRSGEYIAKISWANRGRPGDLGQLMTELAELWVRADPRGGAGVSVSTNTASTPTTAFTQVSTHLPRLIQPGQLQGIIVAVEDFASFADRVKGFLWSAL